VSYTEAMRYKDRIADRRWLAMVYSGISIAYSETYNTDECLKYTNLAYELFTEEGDISNAYRMLYSKAQDYFNLGKLDKADSLYSDIVSHSDVDTLLLSSVYSSLGFLKVNEGEFNKACSLFETALEMSGTLNDLRHWSAYAYTLSKLGRVSESNKLFNAIEQEALTSVDYTYWRGLASMDSKDFELASQYLKTSYARRDSLLNNVLQQSTVKAQRDFYEAQNVKSKARAERLQLWIVIVLLAFLLIVISAISLIKRRTRLAQEERMRLVETSESIRAQWREEHNKFEAERKELRANYLKMYKQQFQLFDSLSETIIAADKQKNETKKHEQVYNKVKAMALDIDSDTEGYKRFEKEINNRMDNIMETFRADFPGWDEDDYRFVSYQFAGFNGNLVAMLRGYPSSSAVYMKKSRLKKLIEASTSERRDFYLAMFS